VPRGALLLVSLVAVAVMAAGSAQGSQELYVPFRTPSKNIACAYFTVGAPATLRCDILSGLKPEPRGRCELDWTGVSMGAGRARAACAGDTVYDLDAPVLGYGKTWQRGPFTCLSMRIGLSCANRTGHGFFLSRESWSAG
jgi:hypothetical protein